MVFKVYFNFNKFLFNLNLDNSGGKSFSIYNTTSKWNTIKVYISGTPVIYTKV